MKRNVVAAAGLVIVWITGCILLLWNPSPSHGDFVGIAALSMVVCPFLLAGTLLIIREAKSFLRERREQQRGFPLDAEAQGNSRWCPAARGPWPGDTS